MTFTFTQKELLLLGLGSLLIALLLPLMVVPVLHAVSQPDDTWTESSLSLSDGDLIRQCRDHIANVASVSFEATRIDKRSTGLRDGKFNVHGYVKQGASEYDFQCWYHEDRSFDTHIIGRVSLQELQQKSSSVF